LFSLRFSHQIPVRLRCLICATCPAPRRPSHYSLFGRPKGSHKVPVTNNNRTVSQITLYNRPTARIVDPQQAVLFRCVANRMCWLRSLRHWVVLLPYGWLHAWRHCCCLNGLTNCCWQHAIYTLTYGKINHS
jgi:hypothetical protein